MNIGKQANRVFSAIDSGASSERKIVQRHSNPHLRIPRRNYYRCCSPISANYLDQCPPRIFRVHPRIRKVLSDHLDEIAGPCSLYVYRLASLIRPDATIVDLHASRCHHNELNALISASERATFKLIEQYLASIMSELSVEWKTQVHNQEREYLLFEEYCGTLHILCKYDAYARVQLDLECGASHQIGLVLNPQCSWRLNVR